MNKVFQASQTPSYYIQNKDKDQNNDPSKNR